MTGAPPLPAPVLRAIRAAELAPPSYAAALNLAMRLNMEPEEIAEVEDRKR